MYLKQVKVEDKYIRAVKVGQNTIVPCYIKFCQANPQSGVSTYSIPSLIAAVTRSSCYLLVETRLRNSFYIGTEALICLEWDSR